MLPLAMRGNLLFCLGFIMLAGCGGGATEKPVEAPDPVEEEAIRDEKEGAEPKPDDVEQKEATEGEGEKGKAKAPAGDPEFKDGMSVDEAITAVPQGTPRINVDQEELGKPLMNESLYKPCKLAPNNHFKLRVGVWDGKAVGIDVTSTPKNPKLEQCIKDQIKTVTWKNAVKSLNTVEYQF